MCYIHTVFGCFVLQTLYVCVDCVKTYCVWVCLLGVVVCALFGCVSWVKASITLPVCIHCVWFGCEHTVFGCVMLYTHCVGVCCVTDTVQGVLLSQFTNNLRNYLFSLFIPLYGQFWKQNDQDL